MDQSRLRWIYKAGIKTLRYDGIFAFVWRIIRLCISPFGYLGMATFYRKDLTQPLREIRGRAELSVTQATESDLGQLLTLVAGKSEAEREETRERNLGLFRRGGKCFLGKIGNEVVHYNWINFSWKESEAGRFIQLRDDEAFCSDAFTVEAWRGRGIHTEINNRMLLFLQQAGYRRAYTHVLTDNKSSEKTLIRVGWEVSGRMLFFIPRGASKGWIIRINGTLDPFVEKKIAAHRSLP